MAYKTLTDALKNIFKYKEGLKFFGKKALYEINEMTVAEIKLSWTCSANDFTQLIVTIQHKENGTIAQNKFIFEEYLKRDECNHPHAKDLQKMYIWADGRDEIDWYIVKPKSTKPIVDAIFEYIDMYK